jgi:hypothetical protein
MSSSGLNVPPRLTQPWSRRGSLGDVRLSQRSERAELPAPYSDEVGHWSKNATGVL